MEQGKRDRMVRKYLLWAALAVLAIIYFETVLGAIGRLWGIAFPLVLGGIVAYVLNIIMVRLEKIWFPSSRNKGIIRSRRLVCILLSIILVLGLGILIICLIVPELAKALTVIGKAIPVYFSQIQAFIVENEDKFPTVADLVGDLKIDWTSALKRAAEFATSGMSSLIGSTVNFVGAVAGGVVNFVVAVIFSIYLLVSKEKLFSQLSRVMKVFVKERWNRKISYGIGVANQCFSSFIVGQCTEAVILGILCTLGMTLLQFPYAPMIGTLIGATALIPVIGAYIGAFVGAFMIFTVSPMKALGFLVFIVILQQLEGNLIYPRVVGSSIGLPGMWVLVAVTIGGGLAGIPGMLFGVPLFATFYKLLQGEVHRRSETESEGQVGKEKVSK